jgi:hypothetical protein
MVKEEIYQQTDKAFNAKNPHKMQKDLHSVQAVEFLVSMIGINSTEPKMSYRYYRNCTGSVLAMLCKYTILLAASVSRNKGKMTYWNRKDVLQ